MLIQIDRAEFNSKTLAFQTLHQSYFFDENLNIKKLIFRSLITNIKIIYLKYYKKIHLFARST